MFSVLNTFLVTYCSSTFCLDFHNQFTFLRKFNLTSSFCCDEVAKGQKLLFLNEFSVITMYAESQSYLNQRVWKTKTNLNSTTQTLEILMPIKCEFCWRCQSFLIYWFWRHQEFQYSKFSKLLFSKVALVCLSIYEFLSSPDIKRLKFQRRNCFFKCFRSIISKTLGYLI